MTIVHVFPLLANQTGPSLVHQPDKSERPLVANPGDGHSRSPVHHLDLPRPANHRSHCQPEGKQTEGNL